jgi:hypothetical protein
MTKDGQTQNSKQPLDLTDHELEELYDLVYNTVFYGDDEIVYTSAGDTLREIWGKLRNEAKRRNLW